MFRLAFLFSLVLVVGCNPDGADTDADTDLGPYTPDWPTLTCDPIAEYCGFPFPNNVFTEADASAPTGRRLALSEDTMPRASLGAGTVPDFYNRADGFSPGSPILAQIPGATEAGLASAANVGSSLAQDARSILLNAETGEPVLHWAELDRLAAKRDDDRTLMMHAAVRLEDATRYIVAYRNLEDAEGATVAPSSAFAALRDGGGGDRARHYDDIFAKLADQGWQRSEVQLAWDFTTRSKEDLTRWLVHMRDDALEIVGNRGPSYTITNVDTDFAPEHVAFRIEGTFQAPLYLDQVDPPARLNFGGGGLPEVNAATPRVTVPFELIIPHSAVDDGPKPLVMYGHGQFGRRSQIRHSDFPSFMNDYGYVFFGIDLMGMDADDGSWLESPATTPLLQARMHDVGAFHDRLHQGFVNHVLALRMMKARFAEDPDYGDYIDGDVAHYFGISQGGIMGVVHAGLGLDFERAALGVMGQPYGVLLPRSKNFAPFFDILRVSLVDGRDVHLALALVQQTWSRVEPDGWSAYATGNMVDDITPPKQIFMRMAEGDHQVTTVGADTMARSLGAVQVETGVRTIHGLEQASSAEGAAAVVTYNLGVPPIPDCNLPMDLCNDPHSPLRFFEEARDQLDHFFRTGEVISFCDGDCDFEEEAECSASETAVATQEVCAL